jgi:hypothetical protein
MNTPYHNQNDVKVAVCEAQLVREVEQAQNLNDTLALTLIALSFLIASWLG